ncbi:uncharacterized protein LOC119463574 isoform X2 [Dermacentor silvarum]|uniref:uncharacterized protein LOC119463574 isoform X2 n=2 Tax=Dermacentor silvarum TaxID=543639 RepID=UPI00210088FA|nr:uncharacterized protein LOC119463574 isoform X2 [Dermacentor silvarum]
MDVLAINDQLAICFAAWSFIGSSKGHGVFQSKKLVCLQLPDMALIFCRDSTTFARRHQHMLVKCWNEESGCEMVTAASKLYEHFFQDCDYHITSCQKCSALILCNDVCAHLKSDCTDFMVSRMSRAPKISYTDPEGILRALNASLDARVGEIKHSLCEALSESSTLLNNRLNELSLCMNAMKEAVLQPSTSEICAEQSGGPETAAGVASIRAVKQIINAHGDRLTKLSSSISSPGYTLNQGVGDTETTSPERLEQSTNNPRIVQAQLSKSLTGSTPSPKEISQSLEVPNEIQIGKGLNPAVSCTSSEIYATNSSSIPAPRESVKQTEQHTKLQRGEDAAENTGNAKRCELIVRGLTSMRKFANINGSYDYVGEKIYLFGYHMLAGVKLIRGNQSLTLHARIKLIKGVNDNFLQWPFHQNIKLIAVHPSGYQTCHCVNYAFHSIAHFGKPGPFGNTALYFPESSLCLENLEREGYTVDDKVQLAWELA